MKSFNRWLANNDKSVCIASSIIYLGLVTSLLGFTAFAPQAVFFSILGLTAGYIFLGIYSSISPR